MARTTSQRPGLRWGLLVLVGLAACSSPGPQAPRLPGSSHPGNRPEAARAAARAAVSLIGVPYRYGGAAPSGFDCSGLVIYSYARAGVPGLPHSVASLERIARPVALEDLQPGDLLFFRLSGKKTSHVAIYVGERTFVHAPSGGKRVERVSFDHVYWGPRVRRAGRLAL